MPLDLNDLTTELSGAMMSMSARFEDASSLNLSDIIGVAVADHHTVKPRKMTGQLELTAGIRSYTAPDNIVRFGSHAWLDDQRRINSPWDPGYPQRSPSVSLIQAQDGPMLELSFAPTVNDIAVLGSSFPFSYFASYGDLAEIPMSDKARLMIRAKAECFLMLNARQEGRGNMPQPGAPKQDFMSVYRELIKEWRSADRL